MRLGLHIEVLFANFGFLAKPQPRVNLLTYDQANMLYCCSALTVIPGLSPLHFLIFFLLTLFKHV